MVSIKKNNVPLEEICEYHRQGYTMAAIARFYGVSRQSIFLKLKYHGKLVNRNKIEIPENDLDNCNSQKK
jgi:uncharacterized protein (DUF433 family)